MKSKTCGLVCSAESQRWESGQNQDLISLQVPLYVKIEGIADKAWNPYKVKKEKKMMNSQN